MWVGGSSICLLPAWWVELNAVIYTYSWHICPCWRLSALAVTSLSHAHIMMHTGCRWQLMWTASLGWRSCNCTVYWPELWLHCCRSAEGYQVSSSVCVRETEAHALYYTTTRAAGCITTILSCCKWTEDTQMSFGLLSTFLSWNRFNLFIHVHVTYADISTQSDFLVCIGYANRYIAGHIRCRLVLLHMIHRIECVCDPSLISTIHISLLPLLWSIWVQDGTTPFTYGEHTVLKVQCTCMYRTHCRTREN